MRKGCFFYFDEICHQRIQTILSLKAMDFSMNIMWIRNINSFLSEKNSRYDKFVGDYQTKST